MKTNEKMRTVKPTGKFCEVENAQLRTVEGGFIGFAVAFAFAALNNYVTAKIWDTSDPEIPIEPLQ